MAHSVVELQEGFDPSDLRNLADCLDETENAASGYGRLKSAVVEVDIAGGQAVATYADGHWSVVFERSNSDGKG